VSRRFFFFKFFCLFFLICGLLNDYSGLSYGFFWLQISKQVPGIALPIERENHTHGFCCTEAGSLWVAQHVANCIKKQTACTNQ